MHKFLYWLIFSNFLFSLSYTGSKILLYTFLSKMFICFLSVFVSIQVYDAYVNVLSSVVFCSLNFSFSYIFVFLKNVCNIKYVMLTFFIFSCKSIWWLLSSLSITPRYLKYSSLSNVYFFKLLIVLIYFGLNFFFSIPLSYILFFLGLCVVLTLWQCFIFLQKVVLF